MIVAFNKRVACTPFTSLSLEKEGKTFAHVKEKTTLFELKVVFETEDFDTVPGQSVWVRGDTKTLQWAKDVFEVQGKQFILVPREYIQLVTLPGETP